MTTGTGGPARRAAPLTSEGRLEVERGYQIAYRVFGTGSRTLLALHGGPGRAAGTSTAWPRSSAATCGSCSTTSSAAATPTGPTIPPVADPALRRPRSRPSARRLDLGVVTLLGQSWGGMLALAYTLDHPQNVNALVLSNTYANGKDYLLDISEHRMALGKDMHALMLKHEAADDLDAPEYLDAVLELNSRHLRRSSPYEPGAVAAGVRRRSPRRTWPTSARPTRSGARTSSRAPGRRPSSTSPTGSARSRCRR